ncbi:MAG: hypothetical protein E6833_38205, partial [Bradyrhizobium sp.]|nr:hypothetical protein [Bradyrhizobium sp.]
MNVSQSGCAKNPLTRAICSSRVNAFHSASSTSLDGSAEGITRALVSDIGGFQDATPGQSRLLTYSKANGNLRGRIRSHDQLQDPSR